MKKAFSSSSRPDAFTKLAIALITVVILLLAALAIPNFMKARTTTSINSCYFNQMWIESAKAKWATENKKSSSDTPTESEVLEYMGKVAPMWDGRKRRGARIPDRLPTCFLSNGTYVVGAVGHRVRCVVKHHIWDEQSYRYHYALGQR